MPVFATKNLGPLGSQEWSKNSHLLTKATSLELNRMSHSWTRKKRVGGVVRFNSREQERIYTTWHPTSCPVFPHCTSCGKQSMEICFPNPNTRYGWLKVALLSTPKQTLNAFVILPADPSISVHRDWLSTQSEVDECHSCHPISSPRNRIRTYRGDRVLDQNQDCAMSDSVNEERDAQLRDAQVIFPELTHLSPTNRDSYSLSQLSPKSS